MVPLVATKLSVTFHCTLSFLYFFFGKISNARKTDLFPPRILCSMLPSMTPPPPSDNNTPHPWDKLSHTSLSPSRKPISFSVSKIVTTSRKPPLYPASGWNGNTPVPKYSHTNPLLILLICLMKLANIGSCIKIFFVRLQSYPLTWAGLPLRSHVIISSPLSTKRFNTSDEASYVPPNHGRPWSRIALGFDESFSFGRQCQPLSW